MEGEQRVRSNEVRRVAFASFIGTTIEWYDFFIFGTAAALVFNQLFFPGADPLIGTLAAFATFAVGFLARPIGGVVFAHFGDRVGRKPMLVLSLMIMGVATVLMGLLPTFEAIGIWAPVLLVALRLAQGFGVGGEWGGAALMSVEHAPDNRRGFYGSWPQTGVPAGLALGTIVFAIVSALVSDAQFAAWGWRIPFLLSALLIVVGMVIRLKVSESPIFERVAQNRQQRTRMPIVETVQTYPKTVALATGSFIASNATFYIASVWIVAYGTQQIGYGQTSLLNAIALLSVIGIPMVLVFGLLSDIVGRRPVYLAGAGLFIVLAFPYFWMINTGNLLLFIIAGALVAACRSAMYGPQSAFFSELFSTQVRYSGASLSYQLASILGGGFAPALCTGLLAWAGSYWPVAVYIIVLNLITLVSVYLMSETFRKDLAEEQEQAPGAVEGRAAGQRG